MPDTDMPAMNMDALYKETIEQFLRDGYAPPNVDRNKVASAVSAAQHFLREGGFVTSTSNFLHDWVAAQTRKYQAGRENMLPDWTQYPPTAARAGKLGFEPVLPGFEISKTTTVIEDDGSVSRQFITQKPAVDKAEFVMPAAHLLERVSARVDENGQFLGGWYKTKKNAPDIEASQLAIKEFMEEYKGYSTLPPAPDQQDENLLTAYWIGDHHLGMYAWKDETGEDYDLTIGESLLRDTMTKLVQRAPASEIGLVVSLGDFFHTDSSQNQTPKSHHSLDIDTRRAKVFKVGLKLMIQCIDLALQKHNKVLVRTLAGNHDPETTPTLAWALWAYYHNNDRVEIDTSSSKFFFYQFGNTMLAGTHGDQTKIAEMPRVMAQYMPKMWGDTVFRYAFGGHVHHRQQFAQKEIGGVIAESVQILPPADSFHAGYGYGAGRSMISTTYSKDAGEMFRNIVNITGSVRPSKVLG